MTERALVLKTFGKIATVQIEKKPECDGCKICAFKQGKSRVKVKALNTAGARPGDAVLVRAEKDNRLLASFLAYVPPVLCAAAGVLVGTLALSSELWAALLCIAGIAVGFVAVWLADRLVSKTKGFGMEVVEIIQDTERKEEKEDGEGI